MVLFRSGLITCLLATTSYAFAFKPSTTHAPSSFATQQRRAPVNLSMSGGASAVPDLKAPPAIYEGAVAAGAGKFEILCNLLVRCHRCSILIAN